MIERHQAKRADGGVQPLADYAGQVLLIVNTASQCGFTPQYAGLEALWRRYRDRGFAVLAFPCNQFGAQEPGSAVNARAKWRRSDRAICQLPGPMTRQSRAA